ncbi:MAG: hypothetical protein DVB23_003372 [Verrucomicrobia bacterium]|jgi:hypothetical protein|nr:MAG: hypothetical protein DVB23_003372 [Verrucomicrobiota bacterium]
MRATPDSPSPVLDEATALYWLMPLRYFYERRGLLLPPVRFIDPPNVPEPDRSLLVHDRDMTPTLAAYHGSDLRLEVLDLDRSDDYLLRLVILRRKDNLKPVECGAIGIQIGRFPPAARELVLAGVVPLGAVLAQEKVPHQGAPRGFFELIADDLIAHALGQQKGDVLHGRCNELSFPDGEAFADIVEILPQMA